MYNRKATLPQTPALWQPSSRRLRKRCLAIEFVAQCDVVAVYCKNARGTSHCLSVSENELERPTPRKAAEYAQMASKSKL